MKKPKHLPLLIAALGLMTGCGGEHFTDGGSSLKPTPVPNSVDVTSPAPEGVKSLTWLWTCDTSNGQEGDRSGNVTLKNSGQYKLSLNRDARIPVKFSGNVCTPQQAPRDIVFVIDVSGSMDGNDPIVNNSCGRLDAVNALLASIPKGSDVRFGIVTFGSDVVAHSSKMQPNSTALFQDAMTSARASTVVDVLCDTNGDTNYDSALKAAEAIFAGGVRTNASKEIFFVSDGAPTSGNDGKARASALRNGGTTIGTVMLKGGAKEEQVLQQDIASKDQSGQALHVRVTASNQLAQAFAKVAKNDLKSAELGWRIAGATTYNKIDLMAQSRDLKFDLPAINISVADAEKGLEVLYDYGDSRGRHYTSQGVVTWQVAE